MILVDVNVLLYVHDTSAPQHDAARRWMEGAMARRDEIAFAWVTLLAFLRISTNPRLFPTGFGMPEAVHILDGYLGRSHISRLDPTVNHWKVLREVCTTAQVTHHLVTDAHLAALAIEHGAALCTTNRGFRRFAGLKLIDPLAA